MNDSLWQWIRTDFVSFYCFFLTKIDSWWQNLSVWNKTLIVKEIRFCAIYTISITNRYLYFPFPGRKIITRILIFRRSKSRELLRILRYYTHDGDALDCCHVFIALLTQLRKHKFLVASVWVMFVKSISKSIQPRWWMNIITIFARHIKRVESCYQTISGSKPDHISGHI